MGAIFYRDATGARPAPIYTVKAGGHKVFEGYDRERAYDALAKDYYHETTALYVDGQLIRECVCADTN